MIKKVYLNRNKKRDQKGRFRNVQHTLKYKTRRKSTSRRFVKAKRGTKVGREENNDCGKRYRLNV